MLDNKQRAYLKDWRERVWYDDNILTARNFAVLLDFIIERDKLWKSLQEPVDMSILNEGS